MNRQLLIIKVVKNWLTAVNFKIDESGRTIAMDVEPNFTYEGGYGRKVSYKFQTYINLSAWNVKIASIW